MLTKVNGTESPSRSLFKFLYAVLDGKIERGFTSPWTNPW